MRKALLLGTGGHVVSIVNWQRAIELAYFRNHGQNVFVLEFHDYEVRSPSKSLKVPSVLLLLGGRDKKFRVRNPPLTKKNVLFRDEFKCQWCGKNLSTNNMTIDHVFPISRGGTNTWRNVVASCYKCNNEKDNRTGPEYEKISGKKLLNRPYIPHYDVVFNADILRNSEYESWKQYVKK